MSGSEGTLLLLKNLKYRGVSKNLIGVGQFIRSEVVVARPKDRVNEPLSISVLRPEHQRTQRAA